MIEISITKDHAGSVSSVKAAGHAGGFRKGENIVCSAVSILLRSYGRCLEAVDKFRIHGEAEDPGMFFVSLDYVPENERCFLDGASSLLITGLMDLYRDYPDEIRIVYE